MLGKCHMNNVALFAFHLYMPKNGTYYRTVCLIENICLDFRLLRASGTHINQIHFTLIFYAIT